MILGQEALGRAALGQISTGAGAVVIPGEDAWHQPFNTDIVRMRKPMHTGAQQFASFVQFAPFNEDIKVSEWFVPFSEPTRFRPRLATTLQQFAAFTQFQVRLDTWFVPFNEPTRFRRALPVSNHQFTGYVQAAPFNEDIKLNEWFVPFSEPTRFRKRLEVSSQQWAATPVIFITTIAVPFSVTLSGVATIGGVPTGNYKQLLATDNRRRLVYAAEISPWTLSQ